MASSKNTPAAPAAPAPAPAPEPFDIALDLEAMKSPAVRRYVEARAKLREKPVDK